MLLHLEIRGSNASNADFNINVTLHRNSDSRALFFADGLDSPLVLAKYHPNITVKYIYHSQYTPNLVISTTMQLDDIELHQGCLPLLCM